MAGSSPGERRGGRQRGTRNKKSEVLLQALQAAGCDPAEQIARVLLSPDTDASMKVDLWVKLLPFLFPVLRAIDPNQYLTIAQAAEMLGNQARRFGEALGAHGVPDIQQRGILASLVKETRW